MSGLGLVLAASLISNAVESSGDRGRWVTVHTQKYISVYRKCVLSNAEVYSKSRDNADTVADAAITSCAPQRVAVLASYVVDYYEIPEPKRSLDTRFFEKIGTEIDRRVKVEATLRIVQLRSGVNK